MTLKDVASTVPVQLRVTFRFLFSVQFDNFFLSIELKLHILVNNAEQWRFYFMKLQKQAKLYIQCHLYPKDLPEVWPSVLINGPPFCGKTMLMKAVAGVTCNILWTYFQTFGVNFLSVSVGMLTPTIRSWREVFVQAKVFIFLNINFQSNAPCILHIDDIESMEKHSAPSGSFRLTCLLKSQILTGSSTYRSSCPFLSRMHRHGRCDCRRNSKSVS